MWLHFLLYLGSICLCGAAPTYVIPIREDALGSTSTSECLIAFNGSRYNLCPVLSRKSMSVLSNIDESGHQLSYRFGLHPPADHACRENTWICATDRRDIDAISVASFVMGSNLPGLYRDEEYSYSIGQDGHLNLKIPGGLDTHGRQQYSEINFICNPDIDDTKMRSLPEFVSRRKDVHFFKWATKYGCSLPKSAMPEIIEEFAFTDSGSDSDSNSDGDKPPDGSELQPPSTHESRRNAATIFLIAICITFFVGYLIWYHPMHLIAQYITPAYDRATKGFTRRRLPRSVRRSTRNTFRVSERRLVRWAMEDSVLGDEDIMVNTFMENDEDWPMDEYIPLKPGMDVTRVKNYGST